MRKYLVSVLILSILFFQAGCKTTQSAAIAPVAGEFLALPFALLIAFDKPGPYGNWWRKEPLDHEKEAFTKALKGPTSPKDKIKQGDFVGWYGVLIGCESMSNSKSRLILDHRFANELNIMFGVRDSQSIHTVSLFEDGLFFADIDYACNSKALSGDLLRVYGHLRQENGETIVSTTDRPRCWPRPTYEISPARAVRDSSQAILKDELGWPKLHVDTSVKNRATAVDTKIFDSLITRLNDPEPEIRARVAYSLGELSYPRSITVLQSALNTEKDESVKKSLVYALKRAEGKTGPYWKPSSPEPYWIETKSP